jgi:serine/threonine protein kinase
VNFPAVEIEGDQPLFCGEVCMATMVRAGRYEITGELGRGAMGVVYRAVDPVIGRNVAVKTIRLSEEGTGLSRPELLKRFQTEARAAGLLTHPNIVVVYDAGEENGLFFITMELVEGKSVQALLDSGHAFPVPRLLRIMEQTCSALQFAHERNIVHRDIKPANLMLTADDTVKVTDFGTAKILQFGTAQQTTHVMGTPSYMSPEQVKGRPVDGRSDIFSLGVMFYEMLTGEKPFPGQSVTTVIYKIVNEDPIPPRQLNPSIHSGLNDIVMRALAKEPEVRYQSCRELQEDLKNYRAIGAGGNNPDATMISARTNTAGGLLPANAGLRGLHSEDPMASPTLRSLQNRVSNPMQTPVIRRTGPVQAYEEPKRKSPFTTVLAALILVGVIVYGGYKLRPELQAVRERNNTGTNAVTAALPSGQQSVAPQFTVPAVTSPQPAAAQVSEPVVAAAAAPPPAKDPNASVTDSSPAQPVSTNVKPGGPAATEIIEKKPDVVEKSGAGKPSAEKPDAEKKVNDAGLTPPAADYKARIVEAVSQQGLGNRLKVSGTGNTLTIAGRLRPQEHATLLHFMRNAPAAVHVVDDIQYDDTAIPGTEKLDDGGHPVPGKGLAAIHIVTDVLAATASIVGPAGRAISECQTPCSFNNLVPERYSLQIRKDGYQPVQTALELKMGETQDQKFHLDSLAKGLFIGTRPAGAEVFINGALQSGKTPVTLPLAPGQFNLVIRFAGYEPYVGQVQVNDNIQTTLNVELTPRAQPQVAWAQVNTTPNGAEIFVDGKSSGQFSPSRIQISSGSHTLDLRLMGFQPEKRMVQVTEGGTVTVNEILKLKN